MKEDSYKVDCKYFVHNLFPRHKISLTYIVTCIAKNQIGSLYGYLRPIFMRCWYRLTAVVKISYSIDSNILMLPTTAV